MFQYGLWSKPICPAGQDKSVTSPGEYDIHENREDCHLVRDHGISPQRGFSKKHINDIPQILQVFAGLCHTLAVLFELRGFLKSKAHKSKSFSSSSTEEQVVKRTLSFKPASSDFLSPAEVW